MIQASWMTSIRLLSGLLLPVLVEATARRSIPDSVERKTSWNDFFFFSSSSARTCTARPFKPLPLALDRRGSDGVTGVDWGRIYYGLVTTSDPTSLMWADSRHLSQEPTSRQQWQQQQLLLHLLWLILIQVAGPTWPLWNSQWVVSSTSPRATVG